MLSLTEYERKLSQTFQQTLASILQTETVSLKHCGFSQRELGVEVVLVLREEVGEWLSEGQSTTRTVGPSVMQVGCHFYESTEFCTCSTADQIVVFNGSL